MRTPWSQRIRMNVSAHNRIACVFLLACVTAWSAPMISIGPHIAIHMEAEVEAKYLSNITMSVHNDQARDDTILTFTPGLELALFENSPHFELLFGAERDFVHFLDMGQFNDEPWALRFRTGYTGDLFSLKFNWDTRESLQNISSAAQTQTPFHFKYDDDIVVNDVDNLGLNFHIAFSPKTGLRSGFSMNDTAYGYASGKPDTLLDYETLAVPLDLFYEITPKLESILGYRYRRVSFANVAGYRDHYVNFGLIGDITAKSDLQVVLGYQNRNRPKQPDTKTQHTFAANLNWKYMATERLHFNLGGSRDFGVGSGEGESIELSSAHAGLDLLFTESMILESGVQLMHSKYSSGRKDLGGNAGTTFNVRPRNSSWEFQGGYRYDWNEFKASGTTYDYKNHNVILGTSWRY